MLKTNPHRSRRSRVMYLLPMIALALSAFATSEFSKASSVIEDVVQKPTPDGERIVIDCYINSKPEVTKFTYNGKEMDPVEGEKILKGRLREGEKATVNITTEINMPKIERYLKSISNDDKLIINYKVVSKEKYVDVHVDADGKIYSNVDGGEMEPISPADLMEKFSKLKDNPAIINLSSDKEMGHMENIVKEACRKNNLLKINYSVLNKE